MSFNTGFLFGSLLSGIVLLILCGIVFVLFVMYNSTNNRLFIIANINGGRYDFSYFKGRIKNSKEGKKYYIPSLKKENLQYATYYGAEHEYSTQKNKVKIVPLFCDGQTYRPVTFEHMKDIVVNHLEEKIKNVDGKDVKDFVMVKETVRVPIMRPIEAGLSSFYLSELSAVKEETALDGSFWNKALPAIMWTATIGGAVTVIVIAIIFTSEIVKNGGVSNVVSVPDIDISAITPP